MKKNILIITIIFTSVLLLTPSCTRHNTASVTPVGLQCEYLTNPLGLDVKHPRLSWTLHVHNENARGQAQTAYRVLVSGTEEQLNQDIGDLWDSGNIRSGQSVHVIYNGKELQVGQTCYWKVSVADENGKWSRWSEPACWIIGLFPGDWKADWIGSPESASQSRAGKPVDNTMPDPWFRKTFILDDKPEEAYIYLASVGYHELYVNGEKISDDILTPSVTDYESRARYRTYDITANLNPGRNVIAIWLGVSWSIFPAYHTDDKPAAPLLLAQAHIKLPGGENIQILTDRTWKTHASPNTLLGYWDAHHFEGEMYDANKEIEGWCDAGFDDSRWDNPVLYNPDLIVSADKTYGNKLIKEIKPLSVEEHTTGVYRIDMGINYAGWFSMPVSGNPGDTITFSFSERENQTSSYGLHSKYIIGPSGKGTFCNRFNYMSGRWVSISGLKEKPSLSQIEAWMIRPEFARIGEFECDIPLLNEIYNTSMWTFENLSLGNFLVDCPHRERRGYGGDALATTRMGMGNYDLGAFYTKWMEDWRDVQQPDGNIPYTAPTHIGGGGPSWSGFAITLPWEMYRQYGDRRVLEESFPTIEHWLSFIETKSKDNMLVRWGGRWSFLGDWLWPKAWPERKHMESQGKALGDTEETLFFNNCHWIYSLNLAADIADIIGNGKSAEYRRRADEIREAVHAKYFNPEDNSYVNGYPSYLAMALHVGLPPVGLRPRVWKRLEDEILINRDGHFWGGITAGSFLFHTLMDNNRNDLIYTMVMKEDFPGWAYMISKGLGTYFEDWECGGSGIHSSYLYVGSWFIEALGGIKQPQAGYKQFVIEPWFNNPEGPRSVKSSCLTTYGKIISNWEVKDNSLRIDVTIPPNTTAVLRLSGIEASSLKESSKPWRQGINTDNTNNSTNIALVPGKYTFTASVIH